MPPSVSEVFLQKAAVDAGFEIPADAAAAPGWLLCRSCRFSLQIWLQPIPAGGAALAISKRDVLEALMRENPQLPPAKNTPAAAAGGVQLPAAEPLHDAVRRAAELELSLPHRLAEAFAQETSAMPQRTEAERLTVQRIGQNRLREGLLRYWQGSCAVTGLAMPDILRASHIKPWRDCAGAEERLNIYNALLLAPHLDALFDRGWISFADDGLICLSPRLGREERRLLGLHEEMKIRRADRAHAPFLSCHRRTIFS